MIAFTLFLPLPLLAGTVPLFFVGLFVFGTTIGALDVSMNVQATEVEAARGRPTMSSFHGFYLAGRPHRRRAGRGHHRRRLGRRQRRRAWWRPSFSSWRSSAIPNLWPSARAAHAGPHFALPNRAAFALGMLAFLAFAIEGSVTDWSALFLSTVKQAGVAEAGAGFAAFSVAMAFFRLSGDTVVARLGPRATMVGGGAGHRCGPAAGDLRALAAPCRGRLRFGRRRVPPISSRSFSAPRRGCQACRPISALRL